MSKPPLPNRERSPTNLCFPAGGRLQWRASHLRVGLPRRPASTVRRSAVKGCAKHPTGRREADHEWDHLHGGDEGARQRLSRLRPGDGDLSVRRSLAVLTHAAVESAAVSSTSCIFLPLPQLAPDDAGLRAFLDGWRVGGTLDD